MTVTIAKYLTPSGRDIHKHGIDPDVTAKMGDKEADRLRLEDIGTQKDSQYRAAETTLVKQIRQGTTVGTPYEPGKANVPAAVSQKN